MRTEMDSNGTGNAAIDMPKETVTSIRLKESTRDRIEKFRENPYEPLDVILNRIMDRAEGKA